MHIMEYMRNIYLYKASQFFSTFNGLSEIQALRLKTQLMSFSRLSCEIDIQTDRNEIRSIFAVDWFLLLKIQLCD